MSQVTGMTFKSIWKVAKTTENLRKFDQINTTYATIGSEEAVNCTAE
jgi:hypothetical protein